MIVLLCINIVLMKIVTKPIQKVDKEACIIQYLKTVLKFDPIW